MFDEEHGVGMSFGEDDEENTGAEETCGECEDDGNDDDHDFEE